MIKKNSFWWRLDKRSGIASRLIIRLAILLGVIFLIMILSRGFSARNPIIQPFEVPLSWTEAGLGGANFAKYVVDELEAIKAFVNSAKADSITISNTDKLDLDVNVMGVGLSLNSLSYYFQNLFGREPKSISGEVLEIDDVIKLTLRMTGYPTQEFKIPIEQNQKFIAIENAIESAAQGVLVNTDPYRVAVYQYKNNDFEGSLNTVRSMIKRNTKDVEWAYLAWSNLLNARGDKKGAFDKIKTAIKINPNFILGQRNIGWRYNESKNYDKAIEHFHNALALEPKSAATAFALGQTYRYNNRIEEAEKYYEKAIELDPETSESYMQWAFLKIGHEDTLGGLNLLKSARKNVKNPIEIYRSLLNFYTIKQQWDSVEIIGNQILELDETDLLTRYGKVEYFFGKKDYDEALVSANEFLNLVDTINGGGVWYTMQTYNHMGMCYYYLKDYPKAVVYAQKAIDKIPDNPIPYTTMAEAYALWGKRNQFYHYLETALELGFPLNVLIDDEPYQPYLNERRFKSLQEKYSLKG